MMLSWLGTVSVPYEIQKCHWGSMWELFLSQSFPRPRRRSVGFRRCIVRVKVVLGVVYPSCADCAVGQYVLFQGPLRSRVGLTRQLVVVLVELVTEPVGSDQHTGFGIANILLFEDIRSSARPVRRGPNEVESVGGPSLHSVGASIPAAPVSL